MTTTPHRGAPRTGKTAVLTVEEMVAEARRRVLDRAEALRSSGEAELADKVTELAEDLDPGGYDDERDRAVAQAFAALLGVTLGKR